MDPRQIKAEIDRIKEAVDTLDGKRGANRAVKQSDLKALASYGMKAPAVSTGVPATDYQALRTDIAKLYELLAKLSNLYGTANK